jgi:hypothetical protein
LVVEQWETVVFRSLLKAEGSRANVANENFSRMVGILSELPPFEMRLMVERARAQGRVMISSGIAACRER